MEKLTADMGTALTRPELNEIYVVELCSGECRRWRYCVPEQSQVWWLDLETGREFSETSVMYSWKIVRKEDPPTGP